MGSFVVNFHVRTEESQPVQLALQSLQADSAVVLPALNGWVSVYEKDASTQDDTRIIKVARRLSQDTSALCVAFLLHDSSVLCYWLFENGIETDRYNSDPAYFDDDAVDVERGGNLDVLLRHARPGTTRNEIDSILTREVVFADDILLGLAQILGIDEERANTDYRDLENGNGPSNDDDTDDDDGPSGFPPHSHASSESSISKSLDELRSRGMTAINSLLKGVIPSPPKASRDPRIASLLQAVMEGDLAVLEKLSADGIDLDAKGNVPMPRVGQAITGYQPALTLNALQAAILYRQEAIARRLVELGANVNANEPRMGACLHLAVTAGFASLVQLLLDHGANKNATNMLGQTAAQQANMLIQMAPQLETMKKMMESIKSPDSVMNIIDVEGWRACQSILNG